jgi:hypothetical protein
MKRIIKVLMASALMVVLMAATVSPAFATHKNQDHAQHYGDGYGLEEDPYRYCGAPKCGGHVFGSAHGSDQNCSYYENPRRSDDC